MIGWEKKEREKGRPEHGIWIELMRFLTKRNISLKNKWSYMKDYKDMVEI